VKCPSRILYEDEVDLASGLLYGPIDFNGDGSAHCLRSNMSTKFGVVGFITKFTVWSRASLKGALTEKEFMLATVVRSSTDVSCGVGCKSKIVNL
jgi:hypothetical protein